MEDLKKPDHALISLSILEYERELSQQIGNLANSEAFSKIVELVDSGFLYSVHIDVMRPPLVPHRSSFPIELIRDVCSHLRSKILIEVHLMVNEPELLIEKINGFVDPEHRTKVALIIQREAYISEEEVINRLRIIKSLGYKAGIGLNFPTPFENLTDEMIENSDLILVMSVPMGKGGQKYEDRATERIRSISRRFPEKLSKVDGGINDKTIKTVIEAGARILVMGSFITRNRRPLDALKRIRRMID